MKRMSSHKGSALLIVIGMLAFMVVSAVAFSAYMRYSRQPSSYLRRSSASRQLIKAALASAIDDIDRAINSNPHPGLGDRPYNGQIGDDYDPGSQSNRNVWVERVLIGSDLYGSDGDWKRKLEDDDGTEIFDETAPVLTLEGLAYIPPSLVNAARYYGRRTKTALKAGRTFDFDAGRFWYVALDVSDYFDVNRLAVDGPRCSSPDRRITLTHIFEDSEHASAPGGNLTSWDKILADFRTKKDKDLAFEYDKLPLVSVADLNLVMGWRLQKYSPFYQYVTSGKDKFYVDPVESKVNEMAFVTDSWFPQTSANSKYTYDTTLTTAKDGLMPGQPFKLDYLKSSSSPTYGTIDANLEEAGRELEKKISTVGMAALCDYLDEDRIPISLACPSVERVPMCCGLKAEIKGTLKLEEAAGNVLLKDDDGAQEAGETDGGPELSRDVYQHVTYKLNGAPVTTCSIDALFMYPFLRDQEEISVKVDGHASLFFTDTKNRAAFRWSGENVPRLGNGEIESFVGCKLNECELAFPNVTKPDAAFKSLTLAGSNPTSISDPFVEVWYKWTQKKDDEENGRWTPMERPENAVVTKVKRWKLIVGDGTEEGGDWEEDEKALSKVINLCAAVRVRVKDGNKTVDLVPACGLDDATENSITSAEDLGKKWPILRFDSDFELSYEAAIKARSSEFNINTTIMVKDPRFNYAPESWCVKDGALDTSTWLAYAADKIGADQDIFMATSDQGYLQSIYELAFLPRFRKNFTGEDPELDFERLEKVDDLKYDKFAISGEEYANKFMWQTYTPFGVDCDDFESLGFTSAGTGFKINPFTDSTDIMMAAFANTPLDWSLAGTNDIETLINMKASEYVKTSAWNAYNIVNAKIKWDHLRQIAKKYREKVQDWAEDLSKGSEDEKSDPRYWENVWQDAWQELWEEGEQGKSRLCGVSLEGDDSVWSVDRKFFYGFWRDCFAVQQQLFLVFVRAEPNMMGGRGQLGARAVALVWRDPLSKQSYPHRTRVLFYRQLD